MGIRSLVILAIGILPLGAADWFVESFDGPAGQSLAGRQPGLRPYHPNATWAADPILKADGTIDDGNNTDRGAFLDLGADFAFAPDQTYTLTLAWSDLSNAVLFAGFATAAPNVNAQMQTQGTNFALRARRINAGTDTLAGWRSPGSLATSGSTITPATGAATLTLETRQLTNARFFVSGLAQPETIDLSAGFRYLWIGYEDPTSGESNARLTSLRFEGPQPATPEPPPLVEILPDLPVIPQGQLITLTATPPGAAIRYTLDGSTPDANATSYTGPFPLANSATIRAVALSQNGSPGPENSRSYTVQQNPARPPSLLIVIGDDVGSGDLGCYGAVQTATPALDTLAREGIRFSQFTTAGPGDHASQFALLTGRVAARSGMTQPPAAGQTGWQAEEWSLAEMLRRRDYQTAMIGAWHLGDAPGSHPNDQGFQWFFGIPHGPAETAPMMENRTAMEPPVPTSERLDRLTQRALAFLAETGKNPFLLVFQAPRLPAGEGLIGNSHAGRIEALDHSVGLLLAALETHGRSADTLVLFLGDGGAPRGDTGGSNSLLRDGAGTTWEGGLRAPLLARQPGTLPAGLMSLGLLWLPDLPVTLAAITGAPLAADRPLDGRARADLLQGTRTRPATGDQAFGLRLQNNTWQISTVRDGAWKSHWNILNLDPENLQPTSTPQIYDLHTDAEERINRASQQAARLTQHQTLADAFRASLPAAGNHDLPPPKPPLHGEPTVWIEFPGGKPTARFAFHRPQDSLDDFYQLQQSGNLRHWSDLPITPFLISRESIGSHEERLELQVPLFPDSGEPPPSRFLRLHATRPVTP